MKTFTISLFMLALFTTLGLQLPGGGPDDAWPGGGGGAPQAAIIKLHTTMKNRVRVTFLENIRDSYQLCWLIDIKGLGRSM